MEKKMLEYFNIIGEINSCISKTDEYEKAIEASIKIIYNRIKCDFAVFWCADESKEILRPLYWLGNGDFTNKSVKNGDGIIGKTFETGDSFKECSEIVVPFFSGEKYGCFEIIRETGENFDSEDGDLLELMSVLLASKFQENDLFPYVWPYNEVLLSANGIEKTFYNGDIVTPVLKGVSLNVYKGEFLVVLGESGCGKSTMLNIIGGMDKATGGSFSFLGKDMTNANEEELTLYRRNNVGFIFQQYNLMPNLTASQNLDIISELVSNPLDSEEALGLVGLVDRKDNYPSQLSGGQQQRVSIARSLVKKPLLIFADEPTAALDYKTSIEVLSVIEEVVKTGTTLVMVTHNEEITKMANRVIRMRDGKLYETTINKHPLHATELVW